MIIIIFSKCRPRADTSSADHSTIRRPNLVLEFSRVYNGKTHQSKKFQKKRSIYETAYLFIYIVSYLALGENICNQFLVSFYRLPWSWSQSGAADAEATADRQDSPGHKTHCWAMKVKRSLALLLLIPHCIGPVIIACLRNPLPEFSRPVAV